MLCWEMDKQSKLEVRLENKELKIFLDIQAKIPNLIAINKAISKAKKVCIIKKDVFEQNITD